MVILSFYLYHIVRFTFITPCNILKVVGWIAIMNDDATTCIIMFKKRNSICHLD